jgi:hypothetical protein
MSLATKLTKRFVRRDVLGLGVRGGVVRSGLARGDVSQHLVIAGHHPTLRATLADRTGLSQLFRHIVCRLFVVGFPPLRTR